MSMEQVGGVPPKKQAPSEERNKILEEIFKRYHKNLIHWCIYRLRNKYPTLPDPESDAEEILAYMYQKLLTSKSQSTIDLTRSEPEVKSLLSVVLDQTIARYVAMTRARKRKPDGGLVSLEEVLGIPGVGKSKDKLDQHKIESALAMLERRNPKMVDIIKKIYQQGKTLEEVGEDYGDTRENIRQLKKRGLMFLRNIMLGRIKSDLSIPIQRGHKKKS